MKKKTKVKQIDYGNMEDTPERYYFSFMLEILVYITGTKKKRTAKSTYI